MKEIRNLEFQIAKNQNEMRKQVQQKNQVFLLFKQFFIYFCFKFNVCSFQFIITFFLKQKYNEIGVQRHKNINQEYFEQFQNGKLQIKQKSQLQQNVMMSSSILIKNQRI
ncbi:hypothetical protein IMG5_002480 [Ichthyophthirius multifiliis]|uniref:Transmembrane protein n=1 Tax=Ichthyophthirius multifiliis TaxID=5932 RepID=G0QJ52_ICHMU|nr:hypothetical protein IMG5_002480 [Ichthyophthirius multifiliis]EGR34776.1 hypothetical protein IMG5_002480 [Ichthyophthirius multifiliis]|eukprot:XP_004040080.1 hypothetical protein IMG5_002480 [Ichthyophthirius multifiliis]